MPVTQGDRWKCTHLCAHTGTGAADVQVHMRGNSKRGNYLLDGRPLLVQASLAECSRVLLYQCTSWHCCERLRSASVNIFEDSFNMFAHFVMGGLQAHLPTLI